MIMRLEEKEGQNFFFLMNRVLIDAELLLGALVVLSNERSDTSRIRI